MLDFSFEHNSATRIIFIFSIVLSFSNGSQYGHDDDLARMQMMFKMCCRILMEGNMVLMTIPDCIQIMSGSKYDCHDAPCMRTIMLKKCLLFSNGSQLWWGSLHR